MPELRWILIAFGLVLLVGIYAWGRRNAKPHAPTDELTLRPRPEPAFEPAEVYDTAPAASDADLDDSMESPRAMLEEDEAPRHTPARAHARSVPEDLSDATLEAPVSRVDRDRRYSRIEPTFVDDTATAELPAHEPPPTPRPRPAASSSSSSSSSDAPTLGMSTTPSPRRIERRKIIALRLATPQRVPGAELRAALEGESLEHGKYDVFHRLDEHGVSIFSIASMVEPGTFDLEKMPHESYPGVTLFAQLPGPVTGIVAFNELIACSRRLHAALGGTLQDERGVPLTVHRIERIRQEIREFEHRPAAESAHRSGPTVSPQL